MKVIEQIQGYEIRYIIISEETGEIIDDANGYGYKTKRKAHSAYNYKYSGGKEKHIQYEKYWKDRNEIAKFIRKFNEMWFKEIYRGEVSEEDLLDGIKESFSEEIDPKMLKYSEYAFKKMKPK